MRLESVSIQNYRIHQNTHVDFDPRMTLICGPNESGKSTLAEAIHRALFLKAKTSGEPLEAMRSVWGEPPQVDLVCSFGQTRCRIQKTFKGVSGKCLLTVEGEPALTGEPAEARLAELLGVDGPIDGRGGMKKLDSRWVHLWVWQGTSGSDPADSAMEQNAALLRRLQAQGGSAVMQSELDTQVLKEIRRRVDGTFVTAGNRYKADSDVARAEVELNGTRVECEEKQQTLAALQDAANRYLAAAEMIAAKQRAVHEAEVQRRTVLANLKRAGEIERSIEPLNRRIAELDNEIERLEKVAKDLMELRNRRQSIQSELAPLEATCRTLASEEEVCCQALRDAERTRDDARQALAAAKCGDNAWAEQVTALERAQEAVRLEELLVGVRGKREARDKVMADLAALPSVSDKNLSSLRKVERERETAQVQLDALGARIEVVEATEAVLVDGQKVGAGLTRTITDDADIRVGSLARLRIRPGQATNLAEARQSLQKAEAKRRESLANLGVATIEEAAAVSERRVQLDGRLEVLKAELAAMGDDTIEAQVSLARQAKAEADTRAVRLAQQAGIKLPTDLDEARRRREEAERNSEEAEQEEKRSHTAFESARERCKQAEEHVAAARVKAAELETRRQETATRIATLEDVHGSDEVRTRTRMDRQDVRQRTGQEVDVLRTDLTALQPEALKSDEQRLNTAMDSAQRTIHTAEQEQAAVRERMRLHGTTDPHADLELSRARLERAQMRFRELDTQAKAIQHLTDLAETAQQRMAQQFTRPLAEAVQGYLECIFGVGTSLGLEWKADAGKFSTLAANRERQGLGTFPFAALSGGAREQVGVAMRLAMAQVLASGHDNCLPIVLDDAFTNSDPERVGLLHRMLYRAAEQGLQVIVLTSNPEHYSTLGAIEVTLRRPELPSATMLSLFPSALPSTNATTGADTVEP